MTAALLTPAVADPPAGKSNPSPPPAEVPAAVYTPVATGVEMVAAKLRSSERVHSALSTLNAYLPTVVSQTAKSSFQTASHLTTQYAQPLVAKVDTRLHTAITTVLSAPSRTAAYSQAKLAAADSIAFAYTPAALKPRYEATRNKTLEVVAQAQERVSTLRALRGDVVWYRVAGGLDQLSQQLQTARQALLAAGANAIQTAHLSQRLAAAQASLQALVSAARAKGAEVQARATAAVPTHEIIAGVTEAVHAITGLLQAAMTEAQAKAMTGVWAQVIAALTAVRAQVAAVVGTPIASAATSPANSRSDSNASSLHFETSEVAPVPAGSDDEHVLTESGTPISPAGGEDASGAAATEAFAHAAEERRAAAAAQPEGAGGAQKRKNKAQRARAKEEEKSKVDAEEADQ